MATINTSDLWQPSEKCDGGGRVSSAKTPHKRSSVGTKAREYFKDYASNASVDGIKYVGEDDRHISEKMFWVFIMLLSLGVCVQQIYNMWLKWTYAPVIVSFDEKSTPVWEIPFPAVTICSETKARQTLFNFTLALYTYDINMTDENLKILSDVSLMCDEQFREGENFTTEEIIDLFRNMSPTMDQMLKEVSWQNAVENTSNIFTPIVTEEGICYTFNMLDPTEIFTNITCQTKLVAQKPTPRDFPAYLEELVMQCRGKKKAFTGNSRVTDDVVPVTEEDEKKRMIVNILQFCHQWKYPGKPVSVCCKCITKLEVCHKLMQDHIKQQREARKPTESISTQVFTM